MEENRTKEFEDTFHKDLASYLEAHDLIDKHFPEAPWARVICPTHCASGTTTPPWHSDG